MRPPPLSSSEELEAARQGAIAVFRKVRVEEPLEEYLAFFEGYQSLVEDLLEETEDLRRLRDQLADLLAHKETREAVRFLAGPPVSRDDLKLIAEAEGMLNRKKLKTDTDMVQRVAQVILSGLDRARFPWVIEAREPTEIERTAAAVASAALMATSKVQTNRRTEGKREQERAVQEALLAGGFEQVASRPIPLLRDAPDPGQFCMESLVGNRKADLVVALWDRRIMPIECKVSNSFTNSYKRLNNDAAVKAKTWRDDLGSLQVVPTAVLSGAYKLHSLVDAQARGLTLFWAHRLEAMLDWIGSTRSG